jgi:hypothetical protein
MIHNAAMLVVTDDVIANNFAFRRHLLTKEPSAIPREKWTRRKSWGWERSLLSNLFPSLRDRRSIDLEGLLLLAGSWVARKEETMLLLPAIQCSQNQCPYSYSCIVMQERCDNNTLVTRCREREESRNDCLASSGTTM